MFELRHLAFFSVFTVLMLSVCRSSICAQTAIFNVPSTDVLPEKVFYIETDFIAHFDRFSSGGFQTFGYRTVYGVRRKLEAGINFYYTRNGINAPKELQPNVKYNIYNKEKYGLAISTGAQFFVPLNKSAGTRVYGLSYSNASKTFGKANGMRLTGGFYNVFGAERDFGTKFGAIAGIEQPIKGRLTFTADWYSGNNRLGYSSAGLSFAVTKRQFVQAGYNFGNNGRGNNAFSAFYGFTY